MHACDQRLREVAASPLLLPLHSWLQAKAFLHHRPGVLREEALGHEEHVQRARRLLDRAAVFWITRRALEHRAGTAGLAVFGPRPGDAGARAFRLDSRSLTDWALPWPASDPLFSDIAFGHEALSAYGVLMVPAPPGLASLDAWFGQGTTEQVQRQASLERQAFLDRVLDAGAPIDVHGRL